MIPVSEGAPQIAVGLRCGRRGDENLNVVGIRVGVRQMEHAVVEADWEVRHVSRKPCGKGSHGRSGRHEQESLTDRIPSIAVAFE
jgi:hypothetical protein